MRRMVRRAVWRALTAGVVLALLQVTPASAFFLFSKNASNQSDSRLYILVGEFPFSIAGQWRAGSGTTQDECQKDYGWLPNGTYSSVGYHANWPGSVVQGPVVILPDKMCVDGFHVRTELFVHSSYPWSSGHYASAGCIKLASTGTPSSAGGDVVSAVYGGAYLGVSALLVA
jgi:hypothetical protein